MRQVQNNENRFFDVTPYLTIGKFSELKDEALTVIFFNIQPTLRQTGEKGHYETNKPIKLI